jgi:hypothetical protein
LVARHSAANYHSARTILALSAGYSAAEASYEQRRSLTAVIIRIRSCTEPRLSRRPFRSRRPTMAAATSSGQKPGPDGSATVSG